MYAQCHVTCHQGRVEKMVHSDIFEILDPNLFLHFVTYRAHSQYHVTCAHGVTQNNKKQFFNPELSIHYTNL